MFAAQGSAIFAIDPGPKSSGVCLLHAPSGPFTAHVLPNLSVLRYLEKIPHVEMAIEGIESYGMAVGREVFETCEWIGRFLQVHAGEQKKIYRREVKIYLCGSSRANDSNVRQALIDRFGGKGTKKAPGLLYGFNSHMYSALGVGVTAFEMKHQTARANLKLMEGGA